ncbi:uncharacterized protein G2W53_020495 [Senna tora]|uniref:Uncharacterized protein n=1 Tax=Senna tora TaxID=362788 RepID=A0A834TZT7_9FABA|nr:uncharacterized protein G2W53_020495 [Senna tora]
MGAIYIIMSLYYDDVASSYNLSTWIEWEGVWILLVMGTNSNDEE